MATRCRKVSGSHFDVRIHEHVVVKTPKGMTPDQMERLVHVQRKLSDIDGIPWAVHDRDANIIIEQRAPGKTLRELGQYIPTSQLAWVEDGHKDICRQIRARGFRLRDRTARNVIGDPETQQVTVIDFVEMFPIRDDGTTDTLQVWRER